MKRIEQIKVDESKWEVSEIESTNFHSYKLIDKELNDIYYLKEILGFEQVSDDEFLVYERKCWTDYSISRLKAVNSKFKLKFQRKFDKLYSINDDILFFTNKDSMCHERCSGFYSIKDNTIINKGEWINGNKVSLIKSDKDDKTILYIKKEINSPLLNNPELLFCVDPESLDPSSDCYSEYRNEYIEVKTIYDIDKIRLEDQRQIVLDEKKLIKERNEKLSNAKSMILKKANN